MLTIERPSQADEAQRRRSALGALGAFVGGGTALQLAWGDAVPPLTLIDVTRLPQTQGIARDGDSLRIGAAVRLETLRRDTLARHHAPLLGAACDSLAALSVRHLATLGGNVGWGFGDTLAALLALDAQAERADGRRLSLTDWLSLAEGPLIAALYVDALPPAVGFYEKIGRRAAFSPSRLALAMCAGLDEEGRLQQVRAAGCGTGLRARRLHHTEQLLHGLRPANAGDAPLRTACALDLPENPSLARLASGVIAGHLMAAATAEAQ